jgi:hypothetical protein
MGISNHKSFVHSSTGIRAFCHVNGAWEATNGVHGGTRWQPAPLLGPALENSVLRPQALSLYSQWLF